MSKKILRIISGVMLIIAVVFLSIVLTHPEFGTVFYIGNLRIGAAIWRAFYLIYAVVMVGLFVASFFCRQEKNWVINIRRSFDGYMGGNLWNVHIAIKKWNLAIFITEISLCNGFPMIVNRQFLDFQKLTMVYLWLTSLRWVVIKRKLIIVAIAIS